jgi:hypothetical protein
MSTVLVDPFPQTKRGCRHPTSPKFASLGRKRETESPVPISTVSRWAEPNPPSRAAKSVIGGKQFAPPPVPAPPVPAPPAPAPPVAVPPVAAPPVAAPPVPAPPVPAPPVPVPAVTPPVAAPPVAVPPVAAPPEAAPPPALPPDAPAGVSSLVPQAVVQPANTNRTGPILPFIMSLPRHAVRLKTAKRTPKSYLPSSARTCDQPGTRTRSRGSRRRSFGNPCRRRAGSGN